MREQLNSTLASLTLLAFLLAVYGLSHWSEWFPDRDRFVNFDDTPDMTAEQISQTSFNELGEKHYSLIAKGMMQYLKQDKNLLLEPEILLFKAQQASWQTTSAKASSNSSGNKLLLSGNVVIEQKNKIPGATLNTETLTLYPQQNYATTQDKVIIRQPGVYIEAIGMDADLNSNRLKLRNKVTSIYEPEDT